MPHLPKRLPTDVYAIKKIGIQNYQKEFYWPISDDLFFSIATFVFDTFDGLYISVEQKDRDVLLSDSSFLSFIINYIHALAVQQYCEKRRIEVVVGPLSKTLYDPEWDKLGQVIENEVHRRGWHYRFRRHIKNLTFNFHLNFLKQILGVFSPDAIGLGSASRIRQEYLIQNNLFIDNHYWPTLLGGCNFREKKKIGKSLSRRIEDFFHYIENYCTQNLLVSFDTTKPSSTWIERLTSLNTIYLFLLEESPATQLFLMTEPGRPINKVVAHVMKQRGAKTVTFEHGNAFGGLVEKSAAYNGPSNCDEYVCPTAGSADSFRFMYEQTVFPEFHHVLFTSTETKFYHNLWKQAQSHPFPKNIRSVMVMGHAMTQYRYPDSPGLLFYFQLDLELRLVSFLKERGFDVLYKVHPYSIQVGMDIFESLDVQIVSEPFENVWHVPDALLFKFTSTTTFGFALIVNRPIFLLDQEEAYWQTEHYRLLTKRCSMISSWIDQRNRVQFDHEQLTEELSKKPEFPDFSYVKKYMFPKDK